MDMARSTGREVFDWEAESDLLQTRDFIVDICTSDGEIVEADAYVTGVDAEHVRISRESNPFNKMHFRIFKRARP